MAKHDVPPLTELTWDRLPPHKRRAERAADKGAGAAADGPPAKVLRAPERSTNPRSVGQAVETAAFVAAQPLPPSSPRARLLASGGSPLSLRATLRWASLAAILVRLLKRGAVAEIRLCKFHPLTGDGDARVLLVEDYTASSWPAVSYARFDPNIIEMASF